MPITAKETIVVPSKSFDKKWLTRIEMSAPGPSEEAAGFFVLTPYNDAGEMLPEQAKYFHVNAIFARIAAGDEELGELMGKFLAYAQKLENEEG